MELAHRFPPSTPIYNKYIPNEFKNLDIENVPTNPDIIYELLGNLHAKNAKAHISEIIFNVKNGNHAFNSHIFRLTRSKNIEMFRSLMDTEKEIVTSKFQCRKCKEYNTTTQTVQLRSADEGMDTIVTCLNSKCEKASYKL